MITKSSFGKAPNGEAAHLYTITNGDISVSVCDYGAHIVSISVPSKSGEAVDVVLGFDCAEDYSRDNYIGATIGRFANRIENGRFSLNGRDYQLPVNDAYSCLHGGNNGFDKKLFEVECGENSVKMSTVSPDMEEGFPGELKFSVRFTATDDTSLLIEYEAESDADTVVNFTNHAYFNLAGAYSGATVEEHRMKLYADGFCESDRHALANGYIIPTRNTDMDFRAERSLGEALNSGCNYIGGAGGIDHNFILDMSYGNFKKAASLYFADTGILMDTYTNCPGVQVYTANHFGDFCGKGNINYPLYGGICFETQNFPNATSFSYFPSPVLKKGDVFRSKTEYKFSVG